MPVERRWSKARKLALEVFFLNHGHGFKSNGSDVSTRRVYWQSIDWLAAEGLIVPAPDDQRGEYSTHWILSDDGWKAGAFLWNVNDQSLAALKRLVVNDAGEVVES